MHLSVYSCACDATVYVLIYPCTNYFLFVQQETLTRFIERLQCEYEAYIDVVQPVQVALYEIKLGLALLLSSVLHESFLDRIAQHDMDKVLVMHTALCSCLVVIAAAAAAAVTIMGFISLLFRFS